MSTDTKTLSERLRINAEEIAGWGAGNEAADVREAADAIDAKDALLREAVAFVAEIAEADIDGESGARSLLSKLTEATKP